MQCFKTLCEWHWVTQIYRTISEGIINLADCFFDMAYDEAKQGLDIYKQHTSDNDKLGVCILTYKSPL
jgi:hypothetical protein